MHFSRPGPLPAEWMGVERATSNSVVVRWRGPAQPSRLGAFLLQYRTHGERKWTRLPPLPPNITEAEVRAPTSLLTER